MKYMVIGIMSGSSLDGLDIAYVSFEKEARAWSYKIEIAECITYNAYWKNALKNAETLSAQEYVILDTAFGKYIGTAINEFILKNNLSYQVSLIGSHGHTVFHIPEKNTTAQIGDGASIAAITALPVVSNLRNMDMALGGQGAPIVPIGEKLLFKDFNFFLNIGGIANLSFASNENYIAYDICAANRVLNYLAATVGKDYDEDGLLAQQGNINTPLLQQLNSLPYYEKSYPKSLSNNFGDNTILSIIKASNIAAPDALCTYTEHIAMQIASEINKHKKTGENRMLITGGGACNQYLINKLNLHIADENFMITLPPTQLIQYKEALIMAFMAVLRWREEPNVICTVTGAIKNSVGGALWMGQE